MSVSNPQTPLVERGKDKELRAFRVKDFQYTSLGMFIIFRLIKNRDVKIVITSKGTTTGTGKTMLAILLCRTVNKIAQDLFNISTEWNARENSFLDSNPYIEFYENADPGAVALVDELEIIVDNRRSMSNKNLAFSHAWQKLRDKNVVTVATAPGLHSLDKRVKENSDIWINVTAQGKANTYYLTYHDFEGYWIPVRMRKGGFKECLYWLPIDDDPDYLYLKKLKHRTETSPSTSETYTKGDINEADRTARQEVAIRLLKLLEEKDGPIDPDKKINDLTQMDIGQLVGPEESDGWGQQTISKLKRTEL